MARDPDHGLEITRIVVAALGVLCGSSLLTGCFNAEQMALKALGETSLSTSASSRILWAGKVKLDGNSEAGARGAQVTPSGVALSNVMIGSSLKKTPSSTANFRLNDGGAGGGP